MTESDTYIFYILIFIATTFFSFCSQYGKSYKFVALPFYISFIIHWLPLSFTDIGADYNNYYNIINGIGWWYSQYSIEPGFQFLSALFNSISGSPHISIFLFKTLTIILFYYGFYLLKRRINIWIGILAFNALIYLQGFYLISMQLAISLLFISSIYLIEQKTKKSIIYLLLACSVHYSSFLLVPIYFLIAYFNHYKKKISKFSIFMIIVILCATLSLYTLVYDFAISNIGVFTGYAAYDIMNQSKGSGLAQYLFFIPIAYFIIVAYKNSKQYNSIFLNSFVTFGAFSLFFALLGYKIEVLMRLNMSFFALYGCYVPFVIFKRRYLKTTFCFSEMSIWIVYLVFRGYIQLNGYFSYDSLSQLNEYSFYNPFIT